MTSVERKVSLRGWIQHCSCCGHDDGIKRRRKAKRVGRSLAIAEGLADLLPPAEDWTWMDELLPCCCGEDGIC